MKFQSDKDKYILEVWMEAVRTAEGEVMQTLGSGLPRRGSSETVEAFVDRHRCYQNDALMKLSYAREELKKLQHQSLDF